MNFAEAENLIVREGTEQDGIFVLVRMGDDPGAERMANLLKALKVVFDNLEGQMQLDRLLAYSIFNLADVVPTNIASWVRNGATWRKEFIEQEQFALLRAVRSIFEGVWSD